MFSNTPTKSKRKPIKVESDGRADFFGFIFQNFLKLKLKHHYSRYTDKRQSIAERVKRTICILLNEPVFLKGNADW